MNQFVVIAMGGAAGAVARFVVANGLYSWLGRGFPHGTLFVNVSGSFLMGLLTELLIQRVLFAAEYRAAILVGFLGAYTTFSTFAIETLYLFEEGSVAKAFLNIFLSTVLCLAAVWIGLVIGRQLFAVDLYPWWGHSFPYAAFAWVLILMCVFALCAEIVGYALNADPPLRGLALIAIAGLSSAAFSYWATVGLGAADRTVAGLVSVFTVTAAIGGAAVWLGAVLGGWLWHLNR